MIALQVCLFVCLFVWLFTCLFAFFVCFVCFFVLSLLSLYDKGFRNVKFLVLVDYEKVLFPLRENTVKNKTREEAPRCSAAQNLSFGS